MEKYIERSLKNIIHFGDTDIFPFPFERLLFEDKFEESKAILLNLHAHFEKLIAQRPPLIEVRLHQVGYFGFRKATQIEPFWNAYYLAVVLAIAEEIEKTRIPLDAETVFSYRYGWNTNNSSIFKEITWNDYRSACLSKSRGYKYVIQTDISDFYDRVNHHKLENELMRMPNCHDLPFRIIKLLSNFSRTVSYGLPVGGPASRILAELALNHSDKHLHSKGITFCRYADDYTIFCNSQSEAYRSLVFLAEKLANDGLSLQKAKTRIIPSKELESIHAFLDPLPSSNPMADEEQKLLNISIRFDPYSPTAEDDYEKLKDAVRSVDVIGILAREMNKTRIDQTVAKQAVNSIKVLDRDLQLASLRILLDPDNLITLAPIFTTLMRAIRTMYLDLPETGKNLVDEWLLHAFRSNSHLVSLDINLCYVVQILSLRHSYEKQKLLVKLYEDTSDHLLRRQIIVTMANWGQHFWIADKKNTFSKLTIWEKRAIIYASFFLGDEGSHWRRHMRSSFDEIESLVRDWSKDRFSNSKKIPA